MTESPPPPPDHVPAPASTAWGTPAATTAAVPAQRPGLVTAAGITLIVLGVLTLVIGVLGLLVTVLFAGAAGGLGETAEVPAGFDGMMGAFAGIVFIFVALVLAWGTLQILVGVKAMSGRGWARITGIVVGAIGALFSLSGLANPDAGGGVVISIALAAANVFVIYALATSGRWFVARTV